MWYNQEMRLQRQTFEVIIPTSIKPLPDKYEMAVARILAQKFQSDVRFIECGTTRTPDVQVLLTKKYWEIKNIKGNGKLTIEDNLKKASKQSDCIVISLLRSAMTPEKAASCIKWYLNHAHTNIKHVILITKRGKTIDFYH